MAHNYPVKLVMTRGRVIDVLDSESVARAVTLLDECDISALPVKNVASHYVGVISRSDIASIRFFNALKKFPDPEKLLVRDFMNLNPPAIVCEEDPLSHAIAVMHKRRIHRVFVIDASNRLTGVLSSTNLTRLLYIDR